MSEVVTDTFLMHKLRRNSTGKCSSNTRNRILFMVSKFIQ